MEKAKNRKLNFEILESITNTQNKIRQWILMDCDKKVVNKTTDNDTKQRRQEQLDQ